MRERERVKEKGREIEKGVWSWEGFKREFKLVQNESIKQVCEDDFKTDQKGRGKKRVCGGKVEVGKRGKGER